MINAKSAWVNGQLKPFADCQVHVTSFGLHYGVGVFEGIRCYRRQDGRSGVFRLHEHIRRLLQSARVFGIPVAYTEDELVQACLEVLRDNQLDEAYIRPLVFTDAGSLGLGATGNPTTTVVFAWRWQSPLGAEAQRKGVRVQVSSFVRAHPNSVMTKAKVTGQYALSVMAKREATRLGFDEALLLDAGGCVAEGTAQNVFAVWNDELHTPPLSSPILAGITRDAAIAIAQGLGFKVVEQTFTRDALYGADEAFFTGTAVEVTPISHIDGLALGRGTPGPVTQRLAAAFTEAVRGPGLTWPQWITFV
ncbi:MAG: branched-chain amino acid transaminase [Deltaproteobacteria bacterium]|nr:branched-chain amino acid transaminase [Deltaproteobacteria bacterium]